MTLLRRATPPAADGAIQRIDPFSVGWDWVDMAVHRLARGQAIERNADDRERLVLVIEGRANVAIDGETLGLQGSRETVFDGPPAPVVLVQPGCGFTLTAASDALVVVAAAPGGPIRRNAVIPPDEIFVEQRGSGQTARRIHHLLPPTAAAGRLIAFEVYTPAGNWSSWPPHKHDTEDPPREARLEEVYFYRFSRPGAFAFQRVYTPDRSVDESLAPADCDVVLVPAGYHPVAAAPGAECYYLNIMAGPGRAWAFSVDPDHAAQMDWNPAAPRAQQDLK
jgi:5-deoxy-glucuronate isomerase